MKVYDVISESYEVDEAPQGFGSKILNKIGSKIPGEIGARAKGNLDVGGEANRLKKELARFMAGSGVGKGQLSVDAFVDFLDQVGLPTNQVASQLQADRAASGTDENSPLTNPEVDMLLMKATQGGFSKQGMKSKKSKFAAPDVPKMPPMGGGRVAPDVQDAMDKLKAAGYTVTK